MKKRSFVLKVMSLVFTLTFILSGCAKTVDDIKVGVYVTKDGMASVTIEEDKIFVLNRHIATSYDPTGNYTIDGDKLVLYVNGDTDKNTIIFKKNGDTLIFETGELADGLIEKGTEFIFTNSITENKVDRNLMTATAEEYGITHENYPKIDGSTSTLHLSKVINLIMYDSQINENYPTVASKTVPSYKRLINGEVDLIIVPSASKDVLNLAKESEVELEFIPVAAEALIFITPIDNEVDNITMEQVREIYLNYGIKNWSKLGGPDKEIVPICRNSDSGSQSQMDNLILENNKMHQDIQKNFVELTMEGLLEQVAFYHNGGLEGGPTESYAIGYTLYTYLKSMGEITGIDESLKILAFDGVVPSEETIADGSYSLTDGYYVHSFQPSHPLSSPSPPALNPSQHQSLLQ